SDFAIFSYIPMISALALSSMGGLEVTSCLVAVLQPNIDSQTHFSGVQGEIEMIRQFTSSSPFFGFQEADKTVKDVLSKMTETDWVHFAYHSMHDNANPPDSGFLLTDGKCLKVSNIIQLLHPHGFLSACHTTIGDKQLSEEAIHIAAKMLFARYDWIIVMIWSILDNNTSRVMEDSYKRLFSDGKISDSRQKLFTMPLRGLMTLVYFGFLSSTLVYKASYLSLNS
ncbi:hypothetical protein HD554DRAFT_2026333, partial [Boletus coccyginus]